ncbi:uncharacterized protein C19orf44 homolog [Orycteropus afer afer]|uniref:Uncharacterized protein C19orf44 homolog n=1 Tax=Orycteropus afer afer TaxID=1230840 RepID=A0AC54ZBE9_ORYAF|nr:uncharacterized protein C19orf44 homolog [Orycteropus afer afer]
MASARKASCSVHDMFGDFSDISLEDSKVEAIRNLQISRSLTKITASQSRFLKRNQMLGERRLFLKESPGLEGGPRPSSGWPLTTTSQTRTNAAFLKLAQIETKIRNRQAQRGLSDVESDPKTSDASLPEGADQVPTRCAAETPWNTDSPQERVRENSTTDSRKGSRFLKKKEPPAENMPRGARLGKERNFPTPKQKKPARTFDSPDSDEEEMKELLGSLVESSGEKETHRNQGFTSTNVSDKEQVELFLSDQIPAWPQDLSLPRPKPFQKPRPPATRSVSGTAPRFSSRTSSPQIPGAGGPTSHTSVLSVTGTSSRSGLPNMGRPKPLSSPRRSKSEARPSEESLSETTDDSRNDFRINLLSLDDLAPAVSEKSELDQEGEGAQQEKRSSLRSWAEAPNRQGSPRCTQARSMASSDSEEGPPTESMVYESLNTKWGATSSQLPLSRDTSASTVSLASSASQEGLPTVSPAYSDDFEASPGLTASGPTGCSEESLDRTLEALSEFSLSQERDRTPQTPKASRKWGRHVTRVIVKESAVQTSDPAFTYRWAEVAGVAAISPSLGSAYVDPTPIASHVVSADTIEALTAHSPAVFALNDLLRQQLALTQQFLEASRHLHASLLASLDQDVFQYHSLEEAKEYIRCHKPTPLTLEDALEEVQKES